MNTWQALDTERGVRLEKAASLRSAIRTIEAVRKDDDQEHPVSHLLSTALVALEEAAHEFSWAADNL